jgi:large subunit ribosomal protein L6
MWAASYSLWCGKEGLVMSRIGQKSIAIPEKVKMDVTDSGAIKVEGPKGKLEWVLPKQIKLRVEGKQAVLDRNIESRNVRALQ